MWIATSRRALRGAALVAVPAALWAFTGSVYACDIGSITATEDCDHGVVVKGTGAGSAEDGTLDVRAPDGSLKKKVQWKAAGKGDLETIADVETTGWAPGTYTLTLEENTEVTVAVEVGLTTCPPPAPRPTPRLTANSNAGPTPTPAGRRQGTPGLPNTGVAPG